MHHNKLNRFGYLALGAGGNGLVDGTLEPCLHTLTGAPLADPLTLQPLDSAIVERGKRNADGTCE